MNNSKLKISILIPTNGKRINLLFDALSTLNSQTFAEVSELILISEEHSMLNKIKPSLSNFSKVKEVITTKENGILLNFLEGMKFAESDYLLLMDDDMIFESNKGVEDLYLFLNSHLNVWAVGPFINENKGMSITLNNKFYDLFKRIFRLWDPEDFTNKVYSCYGKGSANHSDRLPKDPYIGCQWLTNQALLIRKDVFSAYLHDDIKYLNSVHSIQKIKFVDFYITYRLYLKKKDALAFYPKVSVMHLGVSNTSFSKSENIFRETICGFYYYKRFLRHESLLTMFILPNIGRLLYLIVSNIKSPFVLLSLFKNFLISFGILTKNMHKFKSIPVYYSDLNVQRQEEVYKVVEV